MLLCCMIILNELSKRQELKQIYTISLLTGLLYLLYAAVDFFVLPQEVVYKVAFLHLSVVAAQLFLVSFMAYREMNYVFMINLYTLSVVVAALCSVYLLANSLSYTIYLGELYMMIFWVFVVSGLNFKRSLFSATVVAFISVFGVYFFIDLERSEYVMHLLWTLSAFSFGIVGAYLLNESKKELSLELKNREILIQEVHHRVKNNLQIVSALLAIQAKEIEDSKSKDIFLNNRFRIESISIVHELLYGFKDFEQIEFREYLVKLTQSILLVEPRDIKIEIDVSDVFLSLDRAIPLGLVLNELITNSLKYAFVDNKESKIIAIKAELTQEELIVKVSDNGIGGEFSSESEGFGIKLISSLVQKQLKGELDFETDDGFSTIIRLKKEKVGMENE